MTDVNFMVNGRIKYNLLSVHTVFQPVTRQPAGVNSITWSYMPLCSSIVKCVVTTITFTSGYWHVNTIMFVSYITWPDRNSRCAVIVVLEYFVCGSCKGSSSCRRVRQCSTLCCMRRSWAIEFHIFYGQLYCYKAELFWFTKWFVWYLHLLIVCTHHSTILYNCCSDRWWPLACLLWSCDP